MKINEIFEARRTKTSTQDDIDLGVFQRDTLGADINAPARKEQPSTPTLKQAGKERTRRKASTATLPAEAGEKFAALHRLQAQDEISDDEAKQRAGYEDQILEPKPTTPENLPAVINKQIAQTENIEPEWHMVKHLPGYLKQGIRAVGRQVFGTFTSTPLENIQVIANLGGSGPNPEHELDAVINWLHSNGKVDSAAQLHFERSIPNYGADVLVFKAKGYTFLAVKDFAGQYIYSWPSTDESTKKFNEPTERKRLR